MNVVFFSRTIFCSLTPSPADVRANSPGRPPTPANDGEINGPASPFNRRGGISRTKLYELIGAGELKAIKIGRSTRIVASDLRDWVASLPSVTGRQTKPSPRA